MSLSLSTRHSSTEEEEALFRFVYQRKAAELLSLLEKGVCPNVYEVCVGRKEERGIERKGRMIFCEADSLKMIGRSLKERSFIFL